MKFSKLFGMTAAALLLCTSIATAGPIGSEVGPNLVTNGGFETGDFTGWTQSGNTSFTGVTGGGFAHSGSFGAFFGPIGSLGYINQDLATTPGAHYNIHLWYSPTGSHPSDLQVLWDGVEVYREINAAGSGYREIVIDPIAIDSITTLSIGLRNDPSFDGLDDILVRQTPMPPSLLALCLGLLGLAGLEGLRRRRVQA